MYASRKKAIERTQKKREKNLETFRRRVESTDSEVIARRKAILAMDLNTLRDALQREELKAVDALEAFMWKALQVQDELNCIAEVIVECFEWATEVDEKWIGKTKPPLYGIPFSVKGNFHMKGYDCSVGIGKFLDDPMPDECTFVTHLRNLGAVPFVMTNVPQALLSFVTSNSIYGTTLNPHRPDRIPGGSSGGEAALFTAGGAAFGTGSDLLGSLRIPAAMCGITSLKPTECRLKVVGAHGGVPGRGRLGLGYGFYSRTVDEQFFLLKNIIGSPEYADLVPETGRNPLDEEKFTRQQSSVRIGYFDSDGFMAPVPAMSRAVLDTVEKLREQGCTMVSFKVPEVDLAASLMYKNAMPDGGSYSLSLYAADVVDQYMKQFVTMLKVPKCIRLFFAYLLRPFSPQLFLVASSYVRSLDDLRYTQEQTDDYKQRFLQYWKSLEIDALVCPAFTVPAMRPEFGSQLAVCGFSTGLFNLLDLPAGNLPVGKVSKEDDERLLDETVFPVGHNPVLKIVRSAAKDSEGLPTAVQVVTLPQEEEMCLRVMKMIEKASSF